MTVFLVIEENFKRYEQDITVFRTKEKASNYINQRIENILKDPMGFEMEYKNDEIFNIIWKNEDYEEDVEVYTRLTINERTVK